MGLILEIADRVKLYRTALLFSHCLKITQLCGQAAILTLLTRMFELPLHPIQTPAPSIKTKAKKYWGG